MNTDVEYLRETDAYAVFKVDAFAILVWKQAPSMEGVTACRELFRLVRKSLHGQKFGYLAIVEEVAGLSMGGNVRQALSSMLTDYEASIAGASIVFEGKGFRASIVRSVVSAIDFATRLDFPAKVESDVVSAAEWLKQRAGTLPAQTLAATVNRVRRRAQTAAE